jgi:hypothetical protein
MFSEAPDSLLALVRKGRTVAHKSALPAIDLDTPAAIARATDWLNSAAPEAVEGDYGNRTTFAVACRVKDFGVSAETALDLLLADNGWNETKAMPAWGPDDLAGIVANAYAYGTSQPGKLAADAEFEVVDMDDHISRDLPAPAKKPRLYRVGFDEAAAQATAESHPNLIDDVLDQGSFAVIYGPSNSGKTFLALSMAYHVATGLPWDGHPVAKGTVLYVVAEGSRGINKRIAALKKRYAPADSPPLDIIPCPVDMKSSSADVLQTVRLAKEAAEEHGLPAVLIVIDTLSRALAGGDENASTDMGAFVMNVDKLRLATSAAVLVVHHTGKNVANGARGWSGLRAAIDTEIEVGEGGVISFEKQRDMEMLPDIRFRLEAVSLGAGPKGKEITSCVLAIVSEFDEDADRAIEVSAQVKEYYDALTDLGREPATGKQWDASYEAYCKASGLDISDRNLRRWRTELEQAGYVRRTGKTRNSRFQALVFDI